MVAYFHPDTLPELEDVRPELRRAVWAEALSRARRDPPTLAALAVAVTCVAGGAWMGYVYAPDTSLARATNSTVGAIIGTLVGCLVHSQVLTARVRSHLRRSAAPIVDVDDDTNGESSASTA